MQLGELEECSPSKTPVVVNTLGKWQMHWDVVKDVFAVGLREHREPYADYVHLCVAQSTSKQNSGAFALTREETNDRRKLQNCPQTFTLTRTRTTLPVQMTFSLSLPASGQHTFYFWVTPKLGRSRVSLLNRLRRLGLCFWAPVSPLFL